MRPRWRPEMRRGFAGVRTRYPAPLRGAELHNHGLDPGRKRAGKRGRRLYPHPAEWRICSPQIEAE